VTAPLTGFDNDGQNHDGHKQWPWRPRHNRDDFIAVAVMVYLVAVMVYLVAVMVIVSDRDGLCPSLSNPGDVKGYTNENVKN